MKRTPFAEACPREDIAAPTGKPEVRRAYDKRTGAYLGVVVEVLWHAALDKAARLYAVPLEFIDLRAEGSAAK